jgi:hypothetical protein
VVDQVHTTADNKINVEITFQVTFLKGTMMKYIIERSTNVEMMKWLEVFYNHLKKICDQFKNGEITLENAEAQASNELTSTVEVAPTATSVEVMTSVAKEATIVSPMTVAGPGQSSSMLTWIVLIVLLLYIFLNQWRWSAVQTQIADLQTQVSILQSMLQKIQ